MMKMCKLLIICALLVTIFTADVDSARILGVYPAPSISHQVVFREITLELVKRGHQLVVITPYPVFKKEDAPLNPIEIDASGAYELVKNIFLNVDLMKKNNKRGVIMDADSTMQFSNEMAVNIINAFIFFVFDLPEVQRLIEDKNQRFDLVIIEGLGYSTLIFSKVFNAPAVLFSSLFGTPSNYETIGAVSRHPLAYPYFFRTKFGNLGILDKIKELYMEYKLWKFDQENEMAENKFLKSRFGSDAPTVAELKKNVVLLLANSHPFFDGNRPVPPATVYLGAVHLKPIKELPQEFKSYLDNSARGVVYVSLGSNVRSSCMDKDFLDAFLDAFEKIPYDILWKFDGDNLDRVPKNVKIHKWFPQRDLLGHSKIKLFVTQGGMQSTDEAIDVGVPLVGIPIMADQWYNTNKYVEFGIGVQVDSFTMRAEDLVKAVNTVANNPSYKENIIKLRAIMQDQPQKPIDRGVWWIEHVLRHKGSKHLLGATAQMSWSQYLMLDVVAALAVALTILLIILGLVAYYIIRLILEIRYVVKEKQH